METYNIILLIVLAVYFLVGVYPTRNSNSTEDYLISNRGLGRYKNGLSIAASKIGGGLLVTYSTLFFASGTSAIFLFIGFVFGYFIFYFLARNVVEVSHQRKYYTLADLFNRNGDKVGIFIGAITTVSVFGWILTNLVAGSLLIAQLSGASLFLTIAILSTIIGGYLYVGGFNSVIKTDFIQYISIFVIFIIFLALLFKKGTAFEIKEFVSYTPNGEGLPLVQIIGFFILGVLFPLGSAELWQRVYASKDKKEFKYSLIISSVSYIILGLFMSVICFITASQIDLSGEDDALKLYKGLEKILVELNPAIPAIWLIAYLSAIISSADTFVYTTASSIVQDVLLKSKTIDKTRVTWYIKQVILLLLVLALVLGLVFPDVVKITYVFVGITLVLSGLYLCFRKKVKSPKIIIVSGTLGTLLVLVQAFIQTPNITTAVIGFISVIIIYAISKLFKLG